jgi:hypothetical protein
MSPINCIKAPRTGGLRRRFLAGAIAAAAVSTSGFPAGPVFAQNIVVSGGAVQSNSTPTTYDSIEVYGTDGSSNPSTYNADAALTLTGNLNAHDLGLVNINAQVTIRGSVHASAGGVVTLHSGNLSNRGLGTGGLSFDGVGSVVQSGGSFSTDTLLLSNGASMRYDLQSSVWEYLGLSSGATLTLAKDLFYPGYISVDDNGTNLISAGHAITVDNIRVRNSATIAIDQDLRLSGILFLENGGSISRTSETISALAFNANDATLDLIASDTFDPNYTNYTSYVSNGAVVNAPAGASLGYLTVQGTNSNGDRATFNVNGDTHVSNASAYYDGVINLKGGTLTAPQGLSFDGAESVTRTAGNYSTSYLYLSNGASLGYGTRDTITDSVNLASGAALTLAKDLSVTGGITVDGATTTLASAGNAISAGYLDVNHGAAVTLDQNLTLSGYLYLENGGSISRTSETISALAFNVNDAALDLVDGDSFTPGYTSYVQNGAIVNAPAGTALGYLAVQGSNGNGDRASFNVNGDVTLISASAYSDGVIDLVSGTLKTQAVYFTGAGSAVQSGGHYDADYLSLSSGATLAFGLGDSIDSLSINDAGSRLTGLAPLTLSSLTILNGGNLHLGAFTGSGAIANWGLRMAGDGKTFLESLIFAGLITDGPSPLQVIFDPISNMTYVTSTPGAVPEIDPNTAHGAVMLLVGAAGILERRLRRVALARQAS